MDLRYAGQGFHLMLPFAGEDAGAIEDAFLQAHEEAYGHILHEPVEIMTLRLTALADSPTLKLPELEPAHHALRAVATARVPDHGEVPVHARADFRPGHHVAGPAIIAEETATHWLPRAWECSVSPHGHLILTAAPDSETAHPENPRGDVAE